MYGWANHRITRDDLIAFAWSAPMRELAKQVGLSDVGLKKALKAHGVAGPPQGYWNRVHAGRPVPDRPKAPARRPGERPYILVDNRFSGLPTAPLPSSAGPFASAKVPEDLEQLRVQERSAIGRAVSAGKIVVPHSAIRSLLARDEKDLAKASTTLWHRPTPLFDSPYEKRRLRILNAIFLTLARRGHGASAYVDGTHTEFAVVIGDTRVPLHLGETGRKSGSYNRYNAPHPDPKRGASVKLELTAETARWADDEDGTLETKIADICAGLIVEGEREYRSELRRLEEAEERQRLEAEKRRQERLRKANEARVAALVESGRLLAEAENLRSLIAKVAKAVEAGALDLPPNALAEWRAWADGEADKTDPVTSGQVRAHLLPPTDD
ncbi:hypothetical protein [Sphingomonas jatrophae]|uniref:Uncharacterized protein n=1 Tax=Sphingomonas jatrophae TaxID=1166337 RepID=A0A1I6L2T4_9SPHN|nr:hypothetical protein [Sphingomonas jatrophae]SFR97774.1 hypothetical protein SAMN05192580_2205 [Sphingomonas jatrophae]